MMNPHISKYIPPSDKRPSDFESPGQTERDYVDDSSSDSYSDQNVSENRGAGTSDDLIKEIKVGTKGNWFHALPGYFEVSSIKPISTNFRLLATLQTTRLFWANAVTPNAVLTGAVGDICINGNAGKIYICTTAPTTWTSLS